MVTLFNRSTVRATVRNADFQIDACNNHRQKIDIFNKRSIRRVLHYLLRVY